MAKIACNELIKSYDGTNNVLRGINLEIEEGEFFILVGPSGCGKSTLLRIIAGLETVTDGELLIDGEVANDTLPKDRNLTMVFQSYALYPHMSVRDNILFGLDVKKVPKAEQEERLKEAAALLGLEQYLDRKPRELSGGQRQRVALARSVCSRSPICLMDEPLSNLDAKLRSTMRIEIRRLQRKLGLTVIYVTHDQVEAMTMGDRIAVLNNGTIQQLGTPLDLYNRPANEFVASFIGTPQMNLAAARLTEAGLVLNDAVTLPLTDEDRTSLPEGASWTVGFRPEQIYPATPSSVHAIEVRVVSTEMMGNETLIVFEVGDALFTARWQGQHRVENGSTLRISLDPRYAHLFDAQTHELVRAAEELPSVATLNTQGQRSQAPSQTEAASPAGTADPASAGTPASPDVTAVLDDAAACAGIAAA